MTLLRHEDGVEYAADCARQMNQTCVDAEVDVNNVKRFNLSQPCKSPSRRSAMYSYVSFVPSGM